MYNMCDIYSVVFEKVMVFIKARLHLLKVEEDEGLQEVLVQSEI